MISRSFVSDVFSINQNNKKSKEKSFLIEDDKKLNEEEINVISQSIITNPYFLTYTLAFSLRFSGTLYIIDNYKTMSNKVLQND